MKIFISYAREDRAVALKLYKDLRAGGLDAWIDSEDLKPGQKWKSTIRGAIRGSRFFIAVISSESVSKKGFVQKELELALDILGEFPPTEIFVIPVRLNECQPAHGILSELHWVDLFPSYDRGFKKVLETLEHQAISTRIGAEGSFARDKRISSENRDDQSNQPTPGRLRRNLLLMAMVLIGISAVVWLVATMSEPHSDTPDTHLASRADHPTPHAIVVGGYSPQNQRWLDSAELYDFTNDQWVLTGNSIPEPQLCAAGAAKLGNGMVLVAGGGGTKDGGQCSDAVRATSAVRLYDPRKNKWMLGENMHHERSEFAIASLPSGDVFVFGGCVGGCFGPIDGGLRFPDIGFRGEIYNYRAGTWKSITPDCGVRLCNPENDTERRLSDGSCCTPRQRAWAVPVGNGGILVCGGMDGVKLSLDTCDFYDPNYDSAFHDRPWCDGGSMPQSHTTPAIRLRNRNGQALALLPGSRKYMIWEGIGSTCTPRRGEWRLAGELQLQQDHPALTLLTDGRVMITGGTDGSRALDTVQVYDSRENRWSVVASMTTPRVNHAAVSLRNGHVLVVGGLSRPGPDVDALKSAEIYDPETGAWRETASMQDARMRPWAFEIDDP